MQDELGATGATAGARWSETAEKLSFCSSCLGNYRRPRIVAMSLPPLSYCLTASTSNMQ
jgi:hypothetical protein